MPERGRARRRAAVTSRRNRRTRLVPFLNVDVQPIASRGKLMKFYRKELWFETAERRAFLNITSQVEAALKASGVQEGLALVNAMHITASVFINDDESGLHQAYEKWLQKTPAHQGIQHKQ